MKRLEKKFIVQEGPVTDEQKAKFTDIINDLYHRFKKGVLPPEITLEQLQSISERKIWKQQDLGILRIWGKAEVCLSYCNKQLLQKLLKSMTFYCPGDFDEKIMKGFLEEMFSIDEDVAKEEFCLFVTRDKYNDKTLHHNHQMVIADAIKHNLLPRTSIHHVCDMFFRHLLGERRILDETREGNVFYVKNPKVETAFWKITIRLHEFEGWQWDIDIIHYGEPGTATNSIRMGKVWLRNPEFRQFVKE